MMDTALIDGFYCVLRGDETSPAATRKELGRKSVGTRAFRIRIPIDYIIHRLNIYFRYKYEEEEERMEFHLLVQLTRQGDSNREGKARDAGGEAQGLHR